MKVLKTSLLVTVLLLKTVYCADPLWYFGSGQGDWPKNILTDADGNMIISGHSYGAFEGIPNLDPTNTTSDAFIFKVSSQFEIIWKSTFGTSAEDRVSSFCYSSDGNILISGFTRGYFSNGFPSTTYDMFLAKYSVQDGTQIWNTTFGTPSSEDSAKGVAIDAEGNIFLSADSDGNLFGDTSCSSTYTNVWILKLTSDGTLIDHTCFGSTLYETAQQIIVREDAVYVTGSTNGTMPGATASGLNDMFAAKVKISPTLSLVWAKQVGSNQGDDSFGIAVDSQENFVYIAGTISGDIPQASTAFQGFTDFALLKFSTSDGSYQGASTGGSLLLEAFLDVFMGEDGYLYATGYTTAPVLNADLVGNVDGLVLKYDPDSLEGVEAWINGDALKYDSCFASAFVNGALYCVGSNALTTDLENTQAFLVEMKHDSKEKESGNTVGLAVGVSVGGVALIGAFVGGFMFHKKKNQKPHHVIEMPMRTVSEITDIQIHEKLGGGNFGEVFRGTWQKTTPCALKKLKNADMASEFMNEATLLQQVSMPNVVRFFGIFKDEQGSQYLVTEFMTKGALNILLQEKHEELTDMELLMMARDAAAGMQYLASQGIIHRDLAARNLLVKEEEGRLVVKVADFGLSRVASEYYQSSGSSFPVKWSAPEVLNYSKYSSLSDVWSFGIVLWEIFELGRVPYTGKTNDETIQLVLGGYRLPAPKICPEGMYELMQRCWQSNPSDRPTFAAIYESLTDILKKSGWSPEMNETPSSEEGMNNTYSENVLANSNSVQTEPVQKSESTPSVYFSPEKKEENKPESAYSEL